MPQLNATLMSNKDCSLFADYALGKRTLRTMEAITLLTEVEVTADAVEDEETAPQAEKAG